jgi:hypothetical protein
MIIALSGKKQSGKSTAVEDILKRVEHKPYMSKSVAFAGSLKRFVNAFFLAPLEQGEPEWDAEYFKNLKHPCGKTIRELLQIVGTDWCRNLWPDIWVEQWKYWIKQNCSEYELILVPDVRFVNEVKAIQDLGGHVIRLTRNPFPDDKHESETALDLVEAICIGDPDGCYDEKTRFDAIIDNSAMSIEEQNEAVWKLVTERRWV